MTPARVAAARLKNVRAYIHDNFRGASDFAAAVGMSESHLSHIVGTNPRRPITDGMARRLEAKLGLPAGTFDAGIRWPQLSLVDRIDRIERRIERLEGARA